MENLEQEKHTKCMKKMIYKKYINLYAEIVDYGLMVIIQRDMIQFYLMNLMDKYKLQNFYKCQINTQCYVKLKEE